MKVGDVIKTTSIRHEFDGPKVSGSVGYKAPNGRRFVFVLLGDEDKGEGGEELDCDAVFASLGWVRPSTSAAATPPSTTKGESDV